MRLIDLLGLAQLGLFAAGCTINIGGDADDQAATEGAEVQVEVQDGEEAGIRVTSGADGAAVRVGSGSNSVQVSAEDQDGKTTVRVGGLTIEVDEEDEGEEEETEE